jgi:TonB-linked SusC/RagA family outer membrane protein
VPAQKLVHLTFNNAKLSTALKKIESATKAKILFNLEDVQDYTVSAKIENKNVEEAMDIIIGSKPFSYKVVDGFITVYKKAKKANSSNHTLKPVTVSEPQEQKKQGITLSGIIISSADNQPLIGVSVFVAGTSFGTITDMNGHYSLTVPEGTKTVSFNYIGYLTRKLNVADKYLFQLVTMIEEVHQLDEAVVVGFGTQKRASVIGAVTSVKPSDLVITSTNLTTAFAGNIAGIIAQQSSGEPGYDSPSFYIRGASTFGANNSALLILDGVEITSSMLGQIAPETIESFSVLKDATATALYGSRGANGVIIVTTKSGHESEKMNVKLRFETSISMPTIVQKIANGVTYMEAYNEAVKNSTPEGSVYTPFYSDGKIEGTRNHLNPYVFPDNNWYSMLFNDYSINKNLNINVTGGSKYLDYFLNAAVSDESGLVKQPSESPYDVGLDFKKFLFQSNISSNITKTTRVSLKMNTQIMYNHRPNADISDLFYYTMRANPVRFPAVLPAQKNDTYVRYGNNNSWDTGLTDLNPYALLSEGYGKRYYSYLTSVFSIDQKLDFITKGLSCNALVSFYNYTYSSNYRSATPFYYKVLDNYTVDDKGNYNYNTASIGNPGSTYSSYSVGTNGNHEYSFQGKMEYSRLCADKHDINAMIVYHMQENNLNTPSSSENDILPYRQQGLAGRFTYNYNKRYFFEYDFGYNGSENFAKGHRFGFFPAYAIGYLISDEPFFKSLKPIINSLKIRGSYGLAGNDYLSSRFPYITTVSMSTSSNWYVGSNFTDEYGPTISSYGNENATWEKAKKINFGFDLKLLNDFSLTFDFYNEQRTGIFMQRTSLPSSMGLSGSTPWGNVGAVNKHGIDLSADYNHVFNKDFYYTLRGTFTYSHNIVKNEDEPPVLPYEYTSKVGHPINTSWGLVADKLFGSKQEIENSPKQLFGDYGVGDIKYRDLNGDGVIDSNDITALGNGKPGIPEIIYGFGGSLKYHRLDFSCMFQGAERVIVHIYDMDPFCDTSHFGYNITQYIVDNHYSESNPNIHAAYPRLTSVPNINNTQESSFWIKNTNYLRLKSIEVGYSFNSFRFSLSGFNLFYLSPFKYWDPEVNGGGNGLSYPLQRSVKLGIQYEF